MGDLSKKGTVVVMGWGNFDVSSDAARCMRQTAAVAFSIDPTTAIGAEAININIENLLIGGFILARYRHRVA
nr:hypothetical protein [Rhodopirellula sp. SM50]